MCADRTVALRARRHSGFRIPRVKLVASPSQIPASGVRQLSLFASQQGIPRGRIPRVTPASITTRGTSPIGLIDQILRTGSSADLQGIPEKRPAFLPFALSSCNPRGSADQYSRGPRTWNVNSRTSSSSAFSTMSF